MKHITFVLCLLTMIFALAATQAQTAPDTGKSTPAVAPAPRLLTQREAAWKAKKESWTAGGATLEEIQAAVEVARQAEIKAITSGHTELVAPEDVEDCKRAMARAVAAENEAKAKAESAARAKASDDAIAARKAAEHRAELLKYHCPTSQASVDFPRSYIHIGTSEACVYLLLGYPDHINEDALSGKQLVYPNYYYVYINLRGYVENIQSTN
jgi:hypothetical protein